jgi:hypothetical protein
MPRVRLLRHVTRLVVDYFTYAARLVASARRAACCVTYRRLLRLARLVMRLVAPLVVDYSAYTARPVASARRATCRVAHRRLLRLAQAHRRLLHLRRASGCLGTSRSSSRGSSSTTSTTPRV